MDEKQEGTGAMDRENPEGPIRAEASSDPLVTVSEQDLEPYEPKKDNSRNIRKMTVIFLSVMILFGAGTWLFFEAGDHTGEAKIPETAEVLIGRNYEDVVTMFEENGFTNVQTRPLEDLVVGIKNKDGAVEGVSVGGNPDYKKNRWVDADTKILVRYHSHPENIVTQAAESIGATIEESTGIKDAETAIENGISQAEDIKDQVVNSSEYEEFAKKYLHRSVSFDGTVERVDDGGNGQYHIFLSRGKGYIGSMYLIKGVTLKELGVSSVGQLIGKPVHVEGKVTGFDKDTAKMILEPSGFQFR